MVPDPLPTCTMEASPEFITEGDSSLLSWTSTNAISVLIDNGVVSTNPNDSESVFPSAATIYEGIFTGAGGTAICSATVTVGEAIDDTPDFFAFADQTGVELSTLTNSDILQITGISDGRTISISGNGLPKYRICNDSVCSSVDHTWSNSVGSIDNNQYLQLHLTSNSSYLTANTADIIVGSGDDTWSVTTKEERGGRY